MTGPGRFLTLEGGEGAGKTTQIAWLAPALAAATGREVVRTREPGGAPGAEDIRDLLVRGAGDRWDPVSEVLLIAAARREHVVRTIAPALARGAWVVSDRYTDSTLAYQGHGHGLDRAWLSALAARVADGRMPDLTVILDLPVADGLARAAARGGADRFERLGTAFHERLRQGFHAIAAAEPDRCVLVDARGTPAQVARAIVRAVNDRLGIALALPDDLPT